MVPVIQQFQQMEDNVSLKHILLLYVKRNHILTSIHTEGAQTKTSFVTTKHYTFHFTLLKGM